MLKAEGARKRVLAYISSEQNKAATGLEGTRIAGRDFLDLKSVGVAKDRNAPDGSSESNAWAQVSPMLGPKLLGSLLKVFTCS